MDKEQAAKPDTSKPAQFKAESKDDHVAHIAELARSLTSVSPSGAETVRDKILEHVGAIQDPKAHDERKQAEFKAEQEIEAQRARERAALKTQAAADAKAK